MVPGGPSHFVGPFFSGANVSRHHLPRSIADKHLHFNHYDPSHNLLGTATMPTSTSVASQRGKGGFYQHFGTGAPSTGTSGAGSRGEGKEIGTVDGIKVGFTTGFGTATLPTDASVAASRSHCELVYRIVAVLCFVKFTWHEPLLIIK